MTKKQKALGGVNVELGTKAKSLDLTKANTAATLYLSGPEVERLRDILARGSARLADSRSPSKGKTPKLKVVLKLGTKQHRIFVPEVVVRSEKPNLKPVL